MESSSLQPCFYAITHSTEVLANFDIFLILLYQFHVFLPFLFSAIVYFSRIFHASEVYPGGFQGGASMPFFRAWLLWRIALSGTHQPWQGSMTSALIWRSVPPQRSLKIFNFLPEKFKERIQRSPWDHLHLSQAENGDIAMHTHCPENYPITPVKWNSANVKLQVQLLA